MAFFSDLDILIREQCAVCDVNNCHQCKLWFKDVRGFDVTYDVASKKLVDVKPTKRRGMALLRSILL